MSASRRSFYLPELDGLRFFAFLAVFFAHAMPREPEAYRRFLPPSLAEFVGGSWGAGGKGVDLFFVLSSYLITSLLLREYEERGRLDVPSFYARRALRIWPLYFFFLLILNVGPLGSYLPGAQLSTSYLLAFLLLSGNWACAAWGYPPSPAAPLWSVSIEEQFYLAWPFVLSAAGVSRIKKLALVMFGVAAVTRVYLYARGADGIAYWCNTFVRLDSIAAGALLAVVLRGRVLQLRAPARAALAFAGVALWVAAEWADHAFGASPHLIFSYPAVTLGSVLMLLAALGSRSWLKHPALVYLGKISYGLYVYHVLAISLTKLAAPWQLVPPVSFALTVGLSAVSYKYLELPFLKMKEKFARVRSRPVEPVAAEPERTPA